MYQSLWVSSFLHTTHTKEDFDFWNRWSCCKSQQTSHLWLPQTTCAYFLRGKENNFLVFKGLKNSFVKLNIIDIIDQFLNKQFSKSFQVKSLCYTSQLNYVFQPRVMCHMSLGRTKLTNSLERQHELLTHTWLGCAPRNHCKFVSQSALTKWFFHSFFLFSSWDV